MAFRSALFLPVRVWGAMSESQCGALSRQRSPMVSPSFLDRSVSFAVAWRLISFQPAPWNVTPLPRCVPLLSHRPYKLFVNANCVTVWRAWFPTAVAHKRPPFSPTHELPPIHSTIEGSDDIWRSRLGSKEKRKQVWGGESELAGRPSSSRRLGGRAFQAWTAPLIVAYCHAIW